MIPAMTLSLRAGGMMMAKNMPNRATLRALTARAGKISPAKMPMAVPTLHPGMATAMAP